MAPSVVSVVVLCLVFGASFSLPISRDLETVQSSKSLSETDVTGGASALYTETVRSLDEEIKPVPSFTVSFESDHVKRIKRGMVNPGQVPCPSEMKEFHDRCLTQEEYDELGDDYVEES